MIKIPDSAELENFDLREHSLPALDKYVDRRGFMYILHDSVFPEYIKVGRTADLYKRLAQYNSDKPYRTAKMLYISMMFENVYEVERRILAYMYDNTPPTTLSKEWFEVKHKDKLLVIIEKAEEMEKNGEIIQQSNKE